MKRKMHGHPLHRGLDYGRVEWDRANGHDRSLEVVFAEEWEEENKRQPGLNQGWGVLQNLMFAARKGDSGWRTEICRLVIRRREAAVAATAIQWLGTNCGRAFLETTLKKAGYRLLHPSQVEGHQRREDMLNRDIKRLTEELKVATAQLAADRTLLADKAKGLAEREASFFALMMLAGFRTFRRETGKRGRRRVALVDE